MSGWISVEERVPTDSELVAVVYKGNVDLGRWCEGKWFLPPLHATFAALGVNVEWWLPLPVAPAMLTPEQMKRITNEAIAGFEAKRAMLSEPPSQLHSNPEEKT